MKMDLRELRLTGLLVGLCPPSAREPSWSHAAARLQSSVFYDSIRIELDLSAAQAYRSPMALSARNRLRGKIENIELGNIVAHITVRVGSDVIESIITRRSADELKLRVGDTVTAVIKSTEVMLEK